MRYIPLLACGLSLAFAAPTYAGPMPVLPELPPLPTDYQHQGSDGFYAGILGGFAAGPSKGLAAGLVIGNTVSAADILLGVEALGFAASHGEFTLEGSLRAGVPLTETISVFGNAGLGYSFDTNAFVSLGGTLQADVGAGWQVRLDYRYNHDLSGDPGTHKGLMGLVHSF